MTFKEKINETRETWRFPADLFVQNTFVEIVYDSVAVAGEIGEMCNLIKKAFRLKYLTTGHPDLEASGKISEEMVDALYYLFRMCDLLNIDLDEAWEKKMNVNRERYLIK